MGNKLGRRRQVVEEKFTRPQGLYQHKDVDHKKLRKLIIESKLAPCYPGDEDCTCELEECPICFLYYPTLNRSRCCSKSICTECFLQMKAPNSTRPTQCPFCKTSNYAVEYRGAKTKEEKGIEQIEEQRVIEAKIRMRQQEVQDEEDRTQKRLEVSSSDRMTRTLDVECSSRAAQYSRGPVDAEEFVSAQDSCATTPVRQHLQTRQNKDDEFDLDLEDIMVMEAIWHSIQEKGWSKSTTQGDATSSGQHFSTDDRYVSPVPARLTAPPSSSSPSSSSPSGGFACAIAALAERQQLGNGGESSSTYNTCPRNNRINNWVGQDIDDYSSIRQRSVEVDCGSEVAEAGTSYASSDSIQDGGGNCGLVSTTLAPHDDGGDGTLFHNASTGSIIIPESFEEQMMLAMAVSLAEARAIPNVQGVAWN